MNIASMNAPSPQLSQVLHTHQLLSMNGLSGPSLWAANLAKLAAGTNFTENYKAVLESLQHMNKDMSQPLPFDFKLPPPRLSIHPSPLLLTADTQSERAETVLEGENIACFEIGGEKRLCLPQILKTVLADFSLTRINQACDDLYIYCSRCNPEQLELFKQTGNLPLTASTCGLITLSDAERLCSILLHGSTIGLTQDPQEPKKRLLNETCIPVLHECFGNGYGYLKSDLYTSPDDECIECSDCGKHFSMQHFVSHTHSRVENRICHWGFDRQNWRCYLQFDHDSITDSAEGQRLENAYNDIIERFSSFSALPKKRKESSQSQEDCAPKSRRLSEGHPATALSAKPQQRLANPWLLSPSLAFPTSIDWPSMFCKDTSSPKSQSVSAVKMRKPVLANPDSAVPVAEMSRYEKHFAPNIVLQQMVEALEKQSQAKLSSKEEPHDPSPDTPPPSGADERSETRSRYVCALDNLAHMESIFLKTLELASASGADRHEWLQKYMAYSDSIRRQLVADAI